MSRRQPAGPQLDRARPISGPFDRAPAILAAATPDRVLLASREGEGWRKITYLEALNAARAIGQALVDRGLSLERPVLILSGNGIDHGLLALACLNVGIPFVPVSTAYSLVSTDSAKLRDIAALVQPGLVFADDGDRHAAALLAGAPNDAEVVIARGDPDRRALVATIPTDAVESAANAVNPDTVAKLLFTSGTTGTPKGVISTNRMLCSIMQMVRGCYPMLAEEPPVLVDWLPWNHVFGGAVSFCIALYNGGTLYIDDGKPLSDQIEKTVRNLREVAPRVLTKDRLENCGFCGEGVEIVVEVLVDPQRQINHFHGLGDHLRAATEPREKMTNAAVVLLDGDGQVLPVKSWLSGMRR